MASSVFCVVLSELKAGDIVSRLRSSGFRDGEISVLFPDRSGSRQTVARRGSSAPENAAGSTSLPRDIAGPLGLLAGIGQVTLPGIGPFIAAGPLMTVLSVMPLGPSFIGISGALMGMGVPATESKRYESNVRNGSVLIAVHAEDAAGMNNAKEVFQRSGAGDIDSTADCTPSSADLLPVGIVPADQAAIR